MIILATNANCELLLIMRIANEEKIIYKELSYRINGVLFSVHNELGRYRNEKQYCDAIERGLKQAGIKYAREATLPLSFDGEKQGRSKADFLIENAIVLEIKAKSFSGIEDYSQLRRYLISAGKKLGVLVNFRRQHLQIKRILNSQIN